MSLFTVEATDEQPIFRCGYDDPEVLNVALHVRRGDIFGSDLQQDREKFVDIMCELLSVTTYHHRTQDTTLHCRGEW
jgi:hypothetical protein